jgi:hypothetical protein
MSGGVIWRCGCVMQEEKFGEGEGGGSALIPVALSRQGGRLIWTTIPTARRVGRAPACQRQP